MNSLKQARWEIPAAMEFEQEAIHQTTWVIFQQAIVEYHQNDDPILVTVIRKINDSLLGNSLFLII
jgi:hypothetical protein